MDIDDESEIEEISEIREDEGWTLAVIIVLLQEGEGYFIPVQEEEEEEEQYRKPYADNSAIHLDRLEGCCLFPTIDFEIVCGLGMRANLGIIWHEQGF
jgi:hypothetical protein